jgi:hypothetical protein
MSGGNFTFQPLTIGQMLKRGQLKVPANQRSYAWREKQVRYLLQDLNDAIFDQESDDYFLGTVVIVEGGDLPAIVDGQQRLATTSILLARVRDILLELGRDKSAQSIEQTYLGNIDIQTEASVSRIQMNEENNEFYNSAILPSGFRAAAKSVKKADLRQTNARLFNASVLIDEFIRNGLKQSAKEKHVDYLLKWESFINNKARILAVFVSDEFAAYRMFETLNDRGLRASQVDILKNYLFSRCDTRLDEAKMLWREIDTVIEPLGNRSASDEDEGQDDSDKSSDPLIHFFRHFWVTRDGPTKAKDLAEKIRTNLTNEARVMRFLADANKAARDYVAISRSDDPKWRTYPATAKQDIETINSHLRVNQIKPLVFAIAHYLDPAEAAKALQLCVSWSVRFLIAGGRGGMLDTQYSRRAAEIGTGKITKARELREAMKQYVPSNEEFEQAFSVARISRTWLARYLIRAIEKKRKDLPCPEFIENEDVRDVNLEHVLPINPSTGWAVDPDIAEASYNLLGNLALLSSAKNSDVGNLTFAEKKNALAQSGYLTTKEIGEYSEWGREQILDRQKKLASYAPLTWPLEFKS